MDRVFTNGPGDMGSIPGRVIPKTLKMVLEITLMVSSNHSYLIIIINKQVIIFYAKNLPLDQVFLFNTSNQFLLVFQNVKSCWIILYLSWSILTNYIHTGRVFANGLGDWGSIPGPVIPKTFKMVLDTSLLNTQQYKVHIKGKVEQSRERSSALPYTLV